MSFWSMRLRGAIDPHGFAAVDRTVIGHAGGTHGGAATWRPSPLASYKERLGDGAHVRISFKVLDLPKRGIVNCLSMSMEMPMLIRHLADEIG
jgi:hypothetical protein